MYDWRGVTEGVREGSALNRMNSIVVLLIYSPCLSSFSFVERTYIGTASHNICYVYSCELVKCKQNAPEHAHVATAAAAHAAPAAAVAAAVASMGVIDDEP